VKEVDKNTDEYRLFLKYSKEIGMDPSMVQAAGGNTSLKQGNTMWVKASGKWLLDAQSDVFEHNQTKLVFTYNL